MRLEGPFSNKALLGVGWADAEMDNYQRALVPWMELRSRDLLALGPGVDVLSPIELRERLHRAAEEIAAANAGAPPIRRR